MFGSAYLQVLITYLLPGEVISYFAVFVCAYLLPGEADKEFFQKEIFF